MAGPELSSSNTSLMMVRSSSCARGSLTRTSSHHHRRRCGGGGGGVHRCVDRCVNDCAANNRVCPYGAWITSLHVRDVVDNKLCKNSQVFLHPRRSLRFTNYYKPHQVTVYERLGSGGFAHVHRCRVTSSSGQQQKQQKESEQDWAVKFLKHETMVRRSSFWQGASDIATEAHFLQVLDHPHIIHLHGISAGSILSNLASGVERGFFLVLERMEETLRQRIQTWKKKTIPSKGQKKQRKVMTVAEKFAILVDLVKISHAIVLAMEYLHSKQIVFRDLKPDNIGFDQNGVVKLFDFGLAKELKEVRRDHRWTGKYHMTGEAGSRRYMAPEVARNLPYDKSVDVYSFGVLLWDLLFAAAVFKNDEYDDEPEQQQQDNKSTDNTHHIRKCQKKIASKLESLMKKCCSKDADNRPTFSRLKASLEKLLGKIGETSPGESSSESTTQNNDTNTPLKEHSLRESLRSRMNLRSSSTLKPSKIQLRPSSALQEGRFVRGEIRREAASEEFALRPTTFVRGEIRRNAVSEEFSLPAKAELVPRRSKSLVSLQRNN